ncbi:lens fiber membrane intrinsic protein-like [Dromaius novaehollandiae]|uniref:lens fiber membrane intrinsic protein-like n=1 Tax=Dromaius novaehollandiae TaxID=8790 RepID=UPI00311EEBCD
MAAPEPLTPPPRRPGHPLGPGDRRTDGTARTQAPGPAPLGAEGGAAAMPARGGLLCAASGLALLLAATATDFWLQHRAPGGAGCQGLWRVCLGGACRPHAGTPALWDAARVLMLLSVLSATAGIALGLSAAASGARRLRLRVAGVTLLLAAFLALLGLALYTAAAVSVFGKDQADWRFSWSYILGWIAVVLVSSAGLFHVCAASKDPTPESSEVAGA